MLNIPAYHRYRPHPIEILAWGRGWGNFRKRRTLAAVPPSKINQRLKCEREGRREVRLGF